MGLAHFPSETATHICWVLPQLLQNAALRERAALRVRRCTQKAAGEKFLGANSEPGTDFGAEPGEAGGR
jgi:hypothetical protein